MISDLANDLAREFEQRGYQWNGPDGPITPGPEVIQGMLDRLLEAVYTKTTASGEPVGQVEIGRLMARRDDDWPSTLNIYLWIGELDGNALLHS